MNYQIPQIQWILRKTQLNCLLHAFAILVNQVEKLICWWQISPTNGDFPKWSRTFIEFPEFREFKESDKLLKHKLGSIYLSSLLAVSLCHSGKISASHRGDSGFEYSNLFKVILFLSLNSLNSVKTFRENSNVNLQLLAQKKKIHHIMWFILRQHPVTIKCKLTIFNNKHGFFSHHRISVYWPPGVWYSV